MLDAKNHTLKELIVAVDSHLQKDKQKRGYLLTFDAKRKEVIERPGLLGALVGGKDRFTSYYVTQLGSTLDIQNWNFRWADGASRIELTFIGNFGIRVVDEDNARRLVKALHGQGGPEKTLHVLIEKSVHEVVTQIVRDCSANDSLLDFLLDDEQKDVQNPMVNANVNKKVSESISDALGVPFSISFNVHDLPRRSVQIERHPTDFSALDFVGKLKVFTTVYLDLSNYQKYRRANLQGEADMIARIKQFIDEGVAKFIVGKPYYDIASQFETSIKHKVEEFVGKKAAAIGYDIQLFQPRPDIDVLCLTHGFRVELSAAKHEFLPRYSTGHVRMDVVAEVTAKDYTKVARLINPGTDEQRIRELIESQLAQICQDEFRRIDGKKFNLAFDRAPDKTLSGAEDERSVVEILTDALTKKLEDRYGLQVSVVNITPALTEEGERFNNVRGKTTPFNLNITAQADGGAGDKVLIKGEFEVMDIDPTRWDRFGSKDFGYRKQSVVWTPARLAKLKQEFSERANVASDTLTHDEFEKMRKEKAVSDELSEIGQRISSLLENAISKIPDVANRSREWEGIKSLWEQAESMAHKHILDEFGLVIVFRGFHRTDTLTERSRAELIELEHQALRKRAEQDLINSLTRSDDLSKAAHEADVAYMKQLQGIKSDQLNETPEERAKRKQSEDTSIDAQIADMKKSNVWQVLSPASSKSILSEKRPENKPRLRLGDELKNTDSKNKDSPAAPHNDNG